ncbi:MAG: L-serine ammonia-lyase, iron-sulfur-dependent, subunit alpha [Eubacteriales bacterium]|nr:L-serine ammonia-lyase, iron-sulfur-dependent, subunit alpha [Eubacteriales bacterium]
MDPHIYQSYLEILKEELVPALGCTEPIALAYCAAIAKKVYDGEPEHMDVYCSGNIIKNVKSVTVPNSGGMHGIEAAALLGMVGGRADKKLEVLEEVNEEERARTRELLEQGFCTCHLEEGVKNLYIRVELRGKDHLVKVVIAEKHTQLEYVERDGEVLFSLEKQKDAEHKKDIRELLEVKDILNFADEVKMEEIEETIGRQVTLNSAISEEGLRNHYGAEVGRTLLAAYGDDVKVRARARAAAGSDARMNGCSLPVIINSGSGNQGMACSLPVIEFAKEGNVSKERMYRALVVSNLISIHQKKYIGSLSAYCGAVSAACGAGAAITYLHGGDYEAVSRTITNTIANMGGVVCDGAKSSCAAKIASAVDAAIMAYTLENANHYFLPGEGLVQDDVEDTIKNLGYVGRVGMKSTDVTILKLMIQEGIKEEE